MPRSQINEGPRRTAGSAPRSRCGKDRIYTDHGLTEHEPGADPGLRTGLTEAAVREWGTRTLVMSRSWIGWRGSVFQTPGPLRTSWKKRGVKPSALGANRFHDPTVPNGQRCFSNHSTRHKFAEFEADLIQDAAPRREHGHLPTRQGKAEGPKETKAGRSPPRPELARLMYDNGEIYSIRRIWQSCFRCPRRRPFIRVLQRTPGRGWSIRRGIAAVGMQQSHC